METEEFVHKNIANLSHYLSESKIASKIVSEHKELHAPISKLGKIVEKVSIM